MKVFLAYYTETTYLLEFLLLSHRILEEKTPKQALNYKTLHPLKECSTIPKALWRGQLSGLHELGLSFLDQLKTKWRSACYTSMTPFSLHLQLKAHFGNVKEKYLREYCFSGTYVITLLNAGYHFTPDSWKNIHFLEEVIWVLGGLGVG